MNSMWYRSSEPSDLECGMRHRNMGMEHRSMGNGILTHGNGTPAWKWNMDMWGMGQTHGEWNMDTWEMGHGHMGNGTQGMKHGHVGTGILDTCELDTSMGMEHKHGEWNTDTWEMGHGHMGNGMRHMGNTTWTHEVLENQRPWNVLDQLDRVSLEVDVAVETFDWFRLARLFVWEL